MVCKVPKAGETGILLEMQVSFQQKNFALLKMKSERSAQGAGEVWGQKNNTDWEYFVEDISGRGRSALGLPLVAHPKPKI